MKPKSQIEAQVNQLYRHGHAGSLRIIPETQRFMDHAETTEKDAAHPFDAVTADVLTDGPVYIGRRDDHIAVTNTTSDLHDARAQLSWNEKMQKPVLTAVKTGVTIQRHLIDDEPKQLNQATYIPVICAPQLTEYLTRNHRDSYETGVTTVDCDTFTFDVTNQAAHETRRVWSDAYHPVTDYQANGRPDITRRFQG